MCTRSVNLFCSATDLVFSGIGTGNGLYRDSILVKIGNVSQVTHWVRGAESLTMISPRRATLQVLAAGGSPSSLRLAFLLHTIVRWIV